MDLVYLSFTIRSSKSNLLWSQSGLRMGHSPRWVSRSLSGLSPRVSITPRNNRGKRIYSNPCVWILEKIKMVTMAFFVSTWQVHIQVHVMKWLLLSIWRRRYKNHGRIRHKFLWPSLNYLLETGRNSYAPRIVFLNII